MTAGVVEAHYLKCPFCPGRADLETHRCSGCGSLATAVEWAASSPELVMVAATDNAGRGRMWLY